MSQSLVIGFSIVRIIRPIIISEFTLSEPIMTHSSWRHYFFSHWVIIDDTKMTILIKCQLWQLSLQQDANKVPSGWPNRMDNNFLWIRSSGPFLWRSSKGHLWEELEQKDHLDHRTSIRPRARTKVKTVTHRTRTLVQISTNVPHKNKTYKKFVLSKTTRFYWKLSISAQWTGAVRAANTLIMQWTVANHFWICF